MVSTIFAFVFLAGFFVIEALVRQGSAKSLQRGRADRGSTIAIGSSYLLALAVLVIFTIWHFGSFISSLSSWLGLGIMSAGLALRVWSVRVLGASYSRTLRAAEGLVDTGPYAVIRHPGYLASILIWAGSGIAISNWIATVAIAALMCGVYGYRIHAEEEMLINTFGEQYRQYRKRTWRLLPFLF